LVSATTSGPRPPAPLTTYSALPENPIPMRVSSIAGLLAASALSFTAAMTGFVRLASAETVISVRDGRLSVEVQNERLSSVLDRISRDGKVAIIIGDGLGDQRVSTRLEDVPLAEGLRQLLEAHDAFFFFSGAQNAPASLTAVWVYPKGRGRGLAPVPPQAWASTKEFEAKLADADPEWRALSAEALISRNRDRALDVLLRALRDEDDRVRTRALWAALRSGVKPPADVLTKLALGDPAPHVRFLALEALAGDPSLGPIAEQALNDPNADVRSKAQEILRERERAKQRSPRAPRRAPAEERAGQ